MGPEEVLELMRSAPERYESVRAALRYRGDGPTIKAVRELFLRSEAGRRTFGQPADTPEDIKHSEPDGLFGWRCRVWLIDHHRWRLELDLSGGGVDIAASTGRIRSRGTRRDRPAPPSCGSHASAREAPPEMPGCSRRPRIPSGPCTPSTPPASARSTANSSGWTLWRRARCRGRAGRRCG